MTERWLKYLFQCNEKKRDPDRTVQLLSRPQEGVIAT